MDKLLKYGGCSTVERVSSGNPVEEFWLNEGQALRITTLSETEKADDATKQIIETFIAYRKGNLASQDISEILQKALRDCDHAASPRVRYTLARAIPSRLAISVAPSWHLPTKMTVRRCW